MCYLRWFTILMDYSSLPWNFEAFRKFISYQAAQNAAGVIELNKNLPVSNTKRLAEFQKLLNARSGLLWEPSRQNSSEVLFSTEGNVFRNKARVLTSLFLLNPFELRKGFISPTSFSSALASGKVSESEFHDFILSRYQFPHPAYDDNWQQWSASQIKLKPFIFILQILLSLNEKSPENAYLSVEEFARFAHSNPIHGDIAEITKNIIAFRDKPADAPPRVRSDKIDRKIGDLFGFLCMTKYTYYEGSKIRLNLVRLHPDEKVYFSSSRNGISVIDEVKDIIRKGLAESA